MFKTGCILLCSLAILVSGIEVENTTAPSTSTVSTSSTSTTQKTTISPSTSTSTQTPTPTTHVTPTTTAPTTVAPTQPPTPVTPTPDTGKWVVNGTNVTCIIVRMALQFNISYIKFDNKTESRLLNLPSDNDTWSNGTCESTDGLEQELTIWWNSSVQSNQTNVLNLHFTQNLTTKHWALHHLEVEFASVEFPDIKPNSTTKFLHYSDVFTTEIGNSYRCLKNQQLNLTTAENKSGSEIFISNLQFQAFHVADTTAFGYAEDCAFDTPDIVPIAVGCALAILVVIVLAAYLVGRRRSQARGYLSM